MTKEEFKKLKVGDRCYLKDWNGKYTSTEVRYIDNIFGKLIVLLRSKPIHYSKIPLKLKPHQKQSGLMVGSYTVCNH
jgi:hypothetical protein